jgi:hypothetical protein
MNGKSEENSRAIPGKTHYRKEDLAENPEETTADERG